MRISSLAVAATCALGAMSLNMAHAQTVSGYATSAGSGTWKSGTGLCWRTGFWTPAMATAECDPDLVAKPPPPPPPSVAPRAAPPPPPAPAAAPTPPKPTVINLASSELFEFNKATLTPTARTKLDNEVVAKLKDMKSVRFINVNGHTDRLGSAGYNQKLSERRAEAVKAYLVSKGTDASKIETYGFGKTLPIKACPDQKNRKALIECLAPNRRVEVEIQGQ